MTLNKDLTNYGLKKSKIYRNRQLIKRAWILFLNELSFEETYLILLSKIVNKPISNTYFEKLFKNTTAD